MVRQNDSDQWLAATGLSMPLGFIASPLHRLVRFLLLPTLTPNPALIEMIDAVYDARHSRLVTMGPDTGLASCFAP
jgi:hypothetical protein